MTRRQELPMSMQDATPVEGSANVDVEAAISLERFQARIAKEKAAKEFAREMSKGLVRLAALLTEHPLLAHEFRFSLGDITAYAETAEEMAAYTSAVAAAGAKVSKDYPEDPNRHMSVRAAFGPVVLRMHTVREVVCDRVVVGTEKVTKQVPDPEQLAAVPLVEVTEEVERVEWRCRPLLATDAAGGA